jgi:hypothetical protein
MRTALWVMLALGGVTVTAAPAVRLELLFETSGLVPPAVRSGAVQEAARLWAPYGIDVDAAADTDSAEQRGVRLNVVFDLEHGGGSDTELGAIHFSPDGIPDRKIVLYYRALVDLVGNVQPTGLDLRLWPDALRDQVVARALGRALAHELGHFMLRSPHHAEAGLMRPQHHASALADPSRKGFDLMPLDRARLNIVIAARPDVLAAAPTLSAAAGRETTAAHKPARH